MDALFNLVKVLPLVASCVMAAASYPSIPVDLSTPVQQRIAINGPNGESIGCYKTSYFKLSPSFLVPY